MLTPGFDQTKDKILALDKSRPGLGSVIYKFAM